MKTRDSAVLSIDFKLCCGVAKEAVKDQNVLQDNELRIAYGALRPTLALSYTLGPCYPPRLY